MTKNNVTRIYADLNVRAHGGLVRARLSHVGQLLRLGQVVEAYDPDDETSVPATVREVDTEAGFVYLELVARRAAGQADGSDTYTAFVAPVLRYSMGEAQWSPTRALTRKPLRPEL